MELQKKPNRNMQLLAPKFAQMLQNGIDACAEAGYPLMMTEGWRSPARQNYLYQQGREREGKIITNARAWQSLHQYGLAADVCGLVRGKVIYDMPWDKITEIMESFGLKSLAPAELVHFEWDTHFNMQTLRNIQSHEGVQSLWIKVGAV